MVTYGKGIVQRYVYKYVQYPLPHKQRHRASSTATQNHEVCLHARELPHHDGKNGTLSTLNVSHPRQQATSHYCYFYLLESLT